MPESRACATVARSLLRDLLLNARLGNASYGEQKLALLCSAGHVAPSVPSFVTVIVEEGFRHYLSPPSREGEG